MNTRFFQRMLRVTLGLLVMWVAASQSARSQDAPRDLRIGLQTRQAEVRLQGTRPLVAKSAGQELLTVAVDTPLVLRPKDKGVALLDANGQELATAPGVVQVTLDTTTTPENGDAQTSPLPPLISLLGPTRHYDKKPDRPYRGRFEILPGDGGLTAVNIVDTESYLLGVVSSEMSPDYPAEALKAQAVAARTYALRNVGKLGAQGFDLDDTANCQVYGGYFSEDPRVTQAVAGTANQVLTYNGDLIDAVYSSTCGGYTESAENAWGHAVPYLNSIPDFDGDFPGISPRPTDEDGWASFLKTMRALNCLQPKRARPEAFRWVKLITRKELEASLPAEYQVGTVKNIVPVKRGLSGRIYCLRIEGTDKTVTLEKELTIRKAFGMLRSSAFTVDTYRDDNGMPVVFAFWGAGWGHGLGMCQVGAVGLADQGWTYDKILARYYQGAKLETK